MTTSGPVASAGYGGTPQSERKLAPDLARGVMLLLIAMAYAGVYAGVAFGGRLPEGTSVADTVARFVVVLVLDNRAFPMFAVLYGYGLAWMVARRRRAGAADSEIRRLLRRRSLLLVAFGSVHAFLVFPGEILASYGLAGLVLGWLLFRSDRALARTIAVLVPCYAVTVTAAMVSLAAAPDVAGYAVPGYKTVADWSMRLAGAPFTPIFIAVAYPLLLLVVLGFRAGRSGLLDDPSRHRPLLIRIAVGGIAISMLGALPAALIAIDAVRPDIVSTGALLALQVLTGVLGGAGYAAAFGLLALRLDARRGPITQAVSAVGQRSLTFYLLNSVLVAVVLHHDLLAVGDRVDSIGALAVAAAVWLVALAVAAWMDRTGRPGPVDALLRRLVNGRRAHDQRAVDQPRT
ncbi:DUF418 domain-containing protein [Pseudonocardia alaniniphila]|uniref:DUF418 domain-containing protein n=1 Tax=Pseudonocardia alaniniphila TaxID=75291 RepID=A0ABS9TBG7_9PSEU|nr:DUF418 domain-containing protein [Pseudonocardia alaniniphila]MCH6165867.1 DUF418 domain-containing protein [Pseudonocardia alaniniphila]